MFITSFSVQYVPDGWSWMTVYAFPRWVFEGLMVNSFNDFDTGEYVLAAFNFETFNKFNSFWILILNILICQVLAYLALRAKESKLVHIEAQPEYSGLENAASHDSVVLNPTQSTFDMDAESQTSISKNDLNAIYQELASHAVPIRPTIASKKRSRGVELFFDDIYYTVPNPENVKEPITIVKGVTGFVKPGEMCALMGASGAGKTTLLDVLAGRKTSGEVKGNIYLNRQKSSADMMKASSAYVMQDNVHIGVLTVRQTLEYASQLRMNETVPLSDKNKRVDEILEYLGLMEHANTVVGNETIRGLSGGQLRRLSIGVEIVNLPDLIFLDGNALTVHAY